MINDKDFLLIESYLEDTLTEDAKTSFEERLSTEKELNKYLSLVIESNLFLEEFDKQQKIEEWTGILQAEPELNKPFTVIKTLANVKHSQFGRYVLSIAALLLIFITVYIFAPISNPSPDQLASQYWSETAQFSYAEARRGGMPKTIERTTKRIYDLHEAGDYEAALQAIDEFSVSDEKMTLLKGSCYYNMGKIEEAIHTFQQITTLQNSYTEDEAKWYLALCYLKSGDTQKGMKELHEIIAKKRWNYKQATALLREMPR